MCSVGQPDPHTLGPGSPQWYASGADVEIVMEGHNFNVRAHSRGGREQARPRSSPAPLFQRNYGRVPAHGLASRYQQATNHEALIS